jgi:predicted adenine nucleotide alpha hydrolase (AANH) superfamily ATPase
MCIIQITLSLFQRVRDIVFIGTNRWWKDQDRYFNSDWVKSNGYSRSAQISNHIELLHVERAAFRAKTNKPLGGNHKLLK